MADDATTHTVEKIYCTGDNGCANNQALLAELINANGRCKEESGTNPMALAAMMQGCSQNQQWNNPMMYLVWMWMMRWMNGNGWGTGADVANTEALNYNSRAISQLQSTVDNNHNNDLVMQGINGNASAIHELATNLNVDFNSLQTALCGIKSAVEQVGANVGFSAERVINAVNQGDCGIIQAVQNTSCATQKAILEQGYQNQLANERQTGLLGSKIDNFSAAAQLSNCQQTNTLQNNIQDVRNTMVNGFAQIGYATQAQTDAIVQSGQQNTQRLMDFINQHWVAESSQQLQDAKSEISQLKQTQQLLAAIGGGCNCGN